MKRLLSIVIILGIIAYVTVQVIKDRRFNAPSDYDYPISEEIDTDYYDPAVVKEYYATALEVGTYGRSAWRTDFHDVLAPSENDQAEQNKAKYYQQLRVTAKHLEDVLIRSKALKQQGYSNKQIEMLDKHDITPDNLRLKEKYYLVGLNRGSNGASVWELQKMLNSIGDSIPEDGIFNLITVNRLKEYQSANNLFPSGEVDENTLKALLKIK